MKVKAFVVVIFLCVWTAHVMASASKITTEAQEPQPQDKCPVCGMFVAKFSNWVAQIVYKDGTHVFFDGVKDMMKYYLNINKYHPDREKSDISSIYVTDYYNVFFFDGLRAYYVIGSDVKGPMGDELIPFKKEIEAKEFMKDHKGKKILKFGDITSKVLEKF
jgi:copper chaperone NosL